MRERIKPEQIDELKKCVEENKSLTIMMLKTGLPQKSIINALRKYLGVTGKEAAKLGTPYATKTQHLN